MADTLARFLFMARPCGFVSCMLYTAYGRKFCNVSHETNGAYRGNRGVLKNVHAIYKINV